MHIARPKILELNGLAMNMFSCEETAFIAAERLVEESEATFGFESCRVQVPGFPLLEKVAYIHAEGK